MASGTQTNGGPAQPSLLGLPAELRNEIYLLVATGNTRPLLVSRLMQLRAHSKPFPEKKEKIKLETLLDSAVGLHPFSRTCRQLRDEFQPLFLHESEPCHRLIVNNFNVAQTSFAARFLHKCRVMGFRRKGARRHTSRSGIKHRIKLEFHSDSDIIRSAYAFLEQIVAKREYPKEMITQATIKWAMNRSHRMYIYDTSSQLIVRRRTPEMSNAQVARAVTALDLDETRRIFCYVDSIIYGFEPILAIDGPDSWDEEAVQLIRHVWNEKLRRSTNDWRGQEVQSLTVRERIRRHIRKRMRMRMGDESDD